METITPQIIVDLGSWKVPNSEAPRKNPYNQNKYSFINSVYLEFSSLLVNGLNLKKLSFITLFLKGKKTRFRLAACADCRVR